MVRLRTTLFLLAAAVTACSADPPKDYADVPLADLGVALVVSQKDPKTGFVVGGKNATALVKGVREFNGRSVADLEADMRPGATSDVGSHAGFLGADESLSKVLEADNTYVVDELGLTHQELARHLRVLAAAAEKQGEAGGPFVYHGRRFAVKVAWTKGFQDSPFRDGTKTNGYADLVNVGTGKKLGYSLLVPDMIERYGFYEGKGTSYRIDPRDVVSALDFLTPKPPGR